MSTDDVVTLERTYRATAREVWDMWTTRDGFEAWWGPDGFRVEVNRLEARPGGALHFAMIAEHAEAAAALPVGLPPRVETRCRFSRFEPHRRLQLTLVIDFFPGVEPYENTVDVELTPTGDRVRMVITLHPMHLPDMSRRQREAFEGQLGKLDRILAPPSLTRGIAQNPRQP
jgi:uncharacterized protein YndB with AHSA1/START domain